VEAQFHVGNRKQDLHFYSID